MGSSGHVFSVCPRPCDLGEGVTGRLGAGEPGEPWVPGAPPSSGARSSRRRGATHRPSPSSSAAAPRRRRLRTRQRTPPSSPRTPPPRYGRARPPAPGRRGRRGPSDFRRGELPSRSSPSANSQREPLWLGFAGSFAPWRGQNSSERGWGLASLSWVSRGGDCAIRSNKIRPCPPLPSFSLLFRWEPFSPG